MAQPAEIALPGIRTSVDLGMAAAVAALVSVVYWSGEPNSADSDPSRHLAYAQQLWASGFQLRGHPFLPLTALGDGVDLWLGFHYLLVPFSFLGLHWGERVAGVALSVSHAVILAAVIRALGRRPAWVFTLIPLVSSYFAARDHVARPSHLALALLYVSLAAGLGAVRPAWAWVAGFALGLLHLSSPLAPVFCGLGVLGARLDRKSEVLRPLVWSLGGLGLALLARPDRMSFLPVALQVNWTALGGSGTRLAEVAFELRPPPGAVLAEWVGPSCAVALLLAMLGSASPAGSRGTRWAAGLALATGVLMTTRAARFIDFDLGFLAMWVAVIGAGLKRSPASWTGLAAAGLISIASVWSGAQDARRYNLAVAPSDAFLERVAHEVRAWVPPGQMVVTDDPFTTSMVMARLPEYHFVLAYDPAVLFVRSEALYWRWHHLVSAGTLCDQAACSPETRSPVELAWGLHSFESSQWVLLSHFDARHPLATLFRQAPERFELAASLNEGNVSRELWRIKTDGLPP